MQVSHVDDRREWDALVASFDGHHFQQGFEWGAFKSYHGWRPRRLAVTDGDRCSAAMSVLTKRLGGLGLAAMYAPRGPLVRGPESRCAVAALVEEIRRLAASEHAVFLRVSPAWRDDDGELRAMLAANGFLHLPDDYTTWNNPRIVMCLPLDGGEEHVRGQMRKTTRRGIEIAARRGVKICDGGTREDFGELHRLMSENATRKRLPTRRRQYYEKLSRFVDTGDGRLSFAEMNGTRIAAQFSVRFGRTVHCLFYGASPAHLHMEAARALDWDLITWAMSRDCRDVDFGGSATSFPAKETDPGYGVYQYKRGLGCEMRYLTGYYDLVFHASAYRAFRLIETRMLPLAWRLRAKW